MEIENKENKKERLISKGNSHFNKKEFSKAIECYELALSYYPTLYKVIAPTLELAVRRMEAQGEKRNKCKLVKPAGLEQYFFEIIEESGVFDVYWYLKKYGFHHNIDINPLEHYLYIGSLKGLNPSKNFDTQYYIQSNPDLVNTDLHPFVHYIAQGIKEGRRGIPPDPPSFEIKYPVEAPQYVPRIEVGNDDCKKAVRVIAFYLPQFHPIPENDRWWGDGFTEWSNVKPAKPQFVGHYQPHVPDEFIGYYNLLDSEIQGRQIELAKQYGIEGFCFYLYWFNGRKLLEQPVDNYLANNGMNFPFCICWANENWSRRWDGLEQDILMEQHYSADDDISFIANAEKYMRDPRYIRVSGRPLLLVYRPNLFPDMKATSRRWREWCIKNGIGEIYLTYTQSFEKVDPSVYGFDAACEFPPNNSSPPNITHAVESVANDFKSTVYDWRIFLERSENFSRPNYTLFRGVTPSWDNTPRKKNKGTIFHNSSPGLFKQLLINTFNETLLQHKNREEQIVFINAWNEWAEGAHLEPDHLHGYAWLQAVREAHLETIEKFKKIVIVSHDAHPHGAQILCLNMARYLQEHFNISVEMIVLGSGQLISRYEKYSNVHLLEMNLEDKNKIDELLKKIRERGIDKAIVNTTVSGRIIPNLKEHGFHVVSLVHEMPGILRSYKLENQAFQIATQADKVVFPAQQVKDGFEYFLDRKLTNAVIRPQGLYMRNTLRGANANQRARIKVCMQLGIDADDKIIMSAGYADHRKGFDLFVLASINVMQRIPGVYALWVGHLDQPFVDQALKVAEALELRDHFLFTGLVEQPQEYYMAADIFALTSREDPFPSVVMEALDNLTPVVAFMNSGGFENLLKRDCGILVPAGDHDAFAQAIIDLLKNPSRCLKMAERGQSIVEMEYSFRNYMFDLLEFAGILIPRVSVVVPNFKYEKYIRQRLENIANQSHPVFEIIVLDDCSPDNSVEVISEYLKSCPIPNSLDVNKQNSGSVFSQWLKGVEQARGEFVWIAEADDLAEADFLEKMINFFKDPSVVFAYSQSRQIDENGVLLANDYMEYTGDIGDYWRQDYIVEGYEEIKRALCVKNTIPNVSGVLFNRKYLMETLNLVKEEIIKFKVAGDWFLYLHLAMVGKIAFKSSSLNIHRRHTNSVTKINNHLAEVIDIHGRVSKMVGLERHMVDLMRIQLSKLETHFRQ